jgi:hypothetical protein
MDVKGKHAVVITDRAKEIMGVVSISDCGNWVVVTDDATCRYDAEVIPRHHVTRIKFDIGVGDE